MEYNEDSLLNSGAPWNDGEGFKRHLDANRHYIANAAMRYKGQWQAERDEDERIPNVNMDELQAEWEEYVKAKRIAEMGYALGDLPGSEFVSESESDFNKYGVQEEAFREAKKDPSQPDSHDSTEEECLLASKE